MTTPNPTARMLRMAAIATAGLFLLAASAQETFEVALWADDESAAAVPGVVAIDGHPCGGVAVVRLTRMPPHPGQAPLGTELVVDTGARGGELARWSVPVDYEPLALRGAELLVDHHGQRLWIATDGALRAETGGRVYPALVPRQCPSGGVHAESAYAQCAELADLADGRRRFLQYEATCT